MSKMLGGKPKAQKVDTSAQDRLLAEQEARLKKQEADAAAAEDERKKKEQGAAAAKRGRSGGGSLLSGLETGVTPVSEGKRTTLG
jgi:hypothetical protein